MRVSGVTQAVSEEGTSVTESPEQQGPETQPGPSAQPAALDTSQHKRPHRAAIIGSLLAVIVVIAVGTGAYLAGVSGTSAAQHSLALSRRQLKDARSKLSSDQSALSALRAQLQTAQATARQATAQAQAKAKAQYASAMSTLRQKERALTRAERTVKTEQGRLQKSSISADGVYVVGSDIKPGIYHTPGDGGQTGFNCYYATLNSTNTSDITDNNDFDGPETVDVSGAYAFEISGPCTWYRTG